jgi:hypothetical protein
MDADFKRYAFGLVGIWGLALLAALALGGCADNRKAPDNKSAITKGGARAGGTQPDWVPGVPAAALKDQTFGPVTVKAGAVTMNSGSCTTGCSVNQNDMVRWFWSTDIIPDNIGATTKGAADPTTNDRLKCGSPNYTDCQVLVGFDQGYLLRLDGKTLSQAYSENNEVRVVSGTLLMAFYDALVGKPIPNSTEKYRPIPLGIGLKSGTVRGPQVSLTFGDDAGTIVLNGTINGSQFSGTIDFANTANILTDDPNSGARGQLGTFSINTCAAFNCL